MQRTDGKEERLYGLDWLRIIAFALLILYHIGMFFVPWDWHVKTAEPLEWLELPMQALSPWRLTLLFLISGVASRIMLRKMSSAGGYARTRSFRLLVPLLAGVLVFVVPQPWAELQEKTGYPHSLWDFWIHDYFDFGDSRGLILPTYNHLWFVFYLWAYTMLLALLSLAPDRLKHRMQKVFDAAFGSFGLLLALPVILLLFSRAVLYPAFGETHALVDDPYAHTVYGFAFFFGVGLAGARSVWRQILGHWKTAGLLALAGYSVMVFLNLTILGEAAPAEKILFAFARSLLAWGGILALLGFASIHLHKDGPARRYLTDAIFPYYIAHQTIIVAVGHSLKPYDLGPGLEFSIILSATLLGCIATYELVKRIGFLRPLFGLRIGPAVLRSPEALASSKPG